MLREGSVEPIQRDVARRLCAAVMAESRGKWWRREAWRCWGCRQFSRGDPTQMGFAAAADNRGCRFVNTRWEQAGRPYR